MNSTLYNTFYIYHTESHQTRSRSPSRWFVNCLFSHCVNCLNDPSHVKIFTNSIVSFFLLFPAHSLNLPLWYVQSTAAAAIQQFSRKCRFNSILMKFHYLLHYTHRIYFSRLWCDGKKEKLDSKRHFKLCRLTSSHVTRIRRENELIPHNA